MRKLKNTPINTDTIIREKINGISKFSLKKKTPVVFANILNPFGIKKIDQLKSHHSVMLDEAQFRPRIKLQTAPQHEPILVAVT